MKKVIFLLILLAPILAGAQTKTLHWSAPTLLTDGNPIPQDEVISYRVLVGPDKNTMELRAVSPVPHVLFSDLFLNSEDRYVAVEAVSEGRVGVRSKPALLTHFDFDLSIHIKVSIP